MPKLNRNYAYSPDGVTVYKYEKGEEVTGEVAEKAERAGAIDKRTMRKSASPVSEDKSAGPASEDKSAGPVAEVKTDEQGDSSEAE